MHNFTELKNNLHSDKFLKSLHVSNEDFLVKMYYSGDYASDFENGTLNMEDFTVSCKSINNMFSLEYSARLNKLLIETNYFSFPVSDLPLIRKNLDSAERSASDLLCIIEKYFPMKKRL